jgi:uncharacterized protein
VADMNQKIALLEGSELFKGLDGSICTYMASAALSRDYPRQDVIFGEGETRRTPLLLQYVAGDFNCLHQDLYGDLAFLIQVAILLSEPGTDFTGGEFVLSEQRPRMQSRAEPLA